jgi:hypothetical protein
MRWLNVELKHVQNVSQYTSMNYNYYVIALHGVDM